MNVEVLIVSPVKSTVETALKLIEELRSKKAPRYKIRTLLQAVDEVEAGKRSAQELNDLIYRHRNREGDTTKANKKK